MKNYGESSQRSSLSLRKEKETHSLGALRDVGEGGLGDQPVLVGGRAGGGLGGRGVAAVAARGRPLLERIGIRVEVIALLPGAGLVLLAGAATLDLDNAELVVLVRVLVHETARVDTGHVGVHQRLELGEITLVGDATVLGEEQGEAEPLEHLDLLVPSSGDEVATAPRVVVLAQGY